MKGKAIKYSAAELAWIEAHSRDPRPQMCAAFNKKFGRNIALQNINALCKRKGWLTGRTGCFDKGHEPHNKGKPFPVAATHPNCRKTQFKKGERTGIAQKHYKPIGYERITEDGYRERKVNDGPVFKDRWQLVQRLEWEAANGPIPEGYALKCLNGDKQDCRPSNWEPVPRAVLARLNGGRWRKTIAYDDAPDELKPTVMASAKLKHAIAQRKENA